MFPDRRLDRRAALALGALTFPAVAAAQVTMTGPNGVPVPVPIGAGPAPGAGDNALDAEVKRLFEDLNRLLAARDPEVASMFAQGNSMLVGSEADEVCTGRAAIAAQLAKVYALPHTYSFAWDTLVARYLNESAAWIWAEGHEDQTDHNGVKTRTPYRLAAVLVRQRGEWKFQLFSGSEPKGV